MKRSIFAFLAVLALCLSLTGTALAAHESIAGYYAADSCAKDGEQYRCDQDQLVLYDDGTGSAVFNGQPCPMTWRLDGDSFSMEDEEGYHLNGVYNSGTITGHYAGYDYVYVFTGGIPVEDREDGDVQPADGDSKKESVPPADEGQDVPPAAKELNLRYYPAVSCTMGGSERYIQGEYLLLDQEGGGMVLSWGCAYFIDWTMDGGNFSFTDHTGETADGVVEGGRLTAQYRGYDYVWEMSDSYAPITFLAPERWGADLPNILDRADILTDEEEVQLGQRAAALTEQYHCKVYIVTVDDMKNYTRTPNINVFTDEIMTGYHTGYGADRDAIMLTMSMAERDYDLKVDGPFGNASITNYGRGYIERRFRDNFKHDDWYGGFSDYLDTCEKLLEASVNGKPIDVDNNPNLTRISILIAIGCAAILSLIVTYLLKEGMQSVEKKSDARDYVPEGGLEVTFRDETFTHKTVSQVYDPPKSSSSSGGSGGTTVSSSGRSSSSGKF